MYLDYSLRCGNVTSPWSLARPLFQALQFRNFLVDSFRFGFWISTNVYDLRRPEGPDECLNPGDDCEESNPTHDLDGFGVWMFSGNRNATR